MVSDQEIARCVESLLRHHHHQAASSSPSVTPVTVNGVVRQLEAKLGVDLSHKAAFIGDQIDLLLGPPKDHFALAPRPQFHPHNPIPPPPVTTAIAGGGIFAGLPHHADLSFLYPPPPPLPASTALVSGGHHQFHHHHHQQQFSLQQPQPAAAPRPSAPAQKESTTGVKRRGGPGGLSKVCGVSPALQAIVGEPTMARTQIVKQLWAYIRKNNLQDPNNKRKIICNDELRLVFETDCTDMFKMNKLLAKHIITLDPTKDSGPDAKKLKATTAEVDSTNDSDADRYPVVISDALANFFGTGEREMLQSEALKRIWDHIKSNQLEDPMNTMTILCDSKLQQLFGCESFSALEMSEMLSHHLFKQS